MVFRRRTPLSLPRKIRAMVMPAGGWWRALSYMRHRLLRIPDAPHRIARGIGCGIFVSFLPLFGLHFFLAAGAAWLIRGNVVAALLGTAFGNPVTFPLIAVVSVELGHLLLGTGVDGVPALQILTAFAQAGDEVLRNIWAIFSPEPTQWQRLSRFFFGLFIPYLVGGILPGLACAFAGYYLSLPIIGAVQTLRRKRMRDRAERLREAAAARQDGPQA